MNKLLNMKQQLDSLVVFRNALSSTVILKLRRLLAALCNTSTHPMSIINIYADFVAELYHYNDNLSAYIYHFVIEDTNFYITAKARGENVSTLIEETVVCELAFLQALSHLTSQEVKGAIDYAGFLPDWNTSEYDFTLLYQEHIKNIASEGFGMFSKHHVFTVSDTDLLPVKYPDPVSLSEFSGYDHERSLVSENTFALLERRGANNVLLYGDAGTGKSSTVKAIVNEYRHKGLRLIEVKKNQLGKLPYVLEQLYDNPLTFIIFIDDLSFMENDDNFSALKALLEGSVYSKNQNTAIYATSNRQHLVKERISARSGGDDVHINDTLQETASLSARFGLRITFQRPERDVYLKIVEYLAATYGCVIDANLFACAEAFAIRHNGRSPRTARHFVELLRTGLI